MKTAPPRPAPTALPRVNGRSMEPSAPPAGVMLDTAAQIRAQAAQIRIVAVDSDYMPLGNVTGISEEERRLLGDWVAQGAGP